MAVFNDLSNEIYHTRGSDIIWSTTRRPVMLLKDNKVSVPSFSVSFPDFNKSNAYGFAYTNSPFTQSSCLSMISIDPQEWDSGLSYVADIPAGCNYFETEITLTRTTTPSGYLGQPMPDTWASGSTHVPDGNSAVLEAIGPIIRMFSLERSGNSIYLRRKQSVGDGGDRVPWNNPNDNDNGAGGYRAGWTYGGNRKAWPASEVEVKGTGGIAKRRGESNQCSLTDNTNYSSVWSGALIITPGYIKL